MLAEHHKMFARDFANYYTGRSRNEMMHNLVCHLRNVPLSDEDEEVLVDIALMTYDNRNNN